MLNKECVSGRVLRCTFNAERHFAGLHTPCYASKMIAKAIHPNAYPKGQARDEYQEWPEIRSGQGTGVESGHLSRKVLSAGRNRKPTMVKEQKTTKI